MINISYSLRIRQKQLYYAPYKKLLGCYMSAQFELILTCPKSLEGLLKDEATELGLIDAKERIANVQGLADMATAYRLCLWSRLANRVLLVIKRFPLKNAQELYDGVYDIDWRDHLEPTGSLAIEFTGQGSGIDNTHFGALKVKDAIVDRLRNNRGERPSIDKQYPDVRIHARIERGEATVSIDLSGHSLHQRGYRLQQGAAPLKENLAAAILIRAGWPKIAAEGGALVDPMCGVGTLIIEGAMMAADQAPNLYREHWGFNNWLGHIPSIWKQVLQEAKERSEAGLAKPPLWIRGYEADPRLIKPAHNNIERAYLEDWIKVYQGDLATFSPHPDKGQKGLVICNPPYGERLGDEASLLYLYQHFGEALRNQCVGWQAGIFTGAPDLCKRMGIRSHKQYSFFNGTIPCKLVLLNVSPEQFVVQHAEQTTEEASTTKPAAMLSEGAKMFANRLEKNKKQLAKWAKQQNITCYRVYDADMPEYAIAVDLYDDWIHVQEYAPPRSIDPEKAQTRLLDALSAIPQVFDISPEKIVIKRREQQKGKNQYERQNSEGHFMEVQEGDIKLLVNLKDYLDTGLFLDHRPMRLRLQEEAQGKRFLNLYCYTATATVHAIKGGARTTTSVDLSKTYLDWGKRNLLLNGFSERQKLIQADVMEWLENDREEYDLIFIDPPTFSNSKRFEGVFDVQRDHIKLIELAMNRLSNKGVIYFSNNFRKFVFDDDLKEKYHVEEITEQTIDMDFKRNTKIHHAWRITK